MALLALFLIVAAPFSAPAGDAPAVSAPARNAEPDPASSTADLAASRAPSSPRAAAEAFCAAILDSDADAAAERLAAPQPLWTTMDEFETFIDANGLALLARPWRVSGEAGLGETRCRLWLTTNDDAPAHTFSLILVRTPGGEWRIREVDGYDVAAASPAGTQPEEPVRVILAEAERTELAATYEDALNRGAFADAFDAGFRLWQGGALSYDVLNGVLSRWHRAARNGTGDMSGIEERAARLYAAVRDDSTPVRWRMYPDRAYPIPLNLKAAFDYHERMAGLSTLRQDPADLSRHRRQALDALIQAYGFAKDRPARVYLLEAAVPYYRSLAREGADHAFTPRERRLYQATLLRHVRSVVPRTRREPGAAPGTAGRSTAPGPPRGAAAASDAFRLLREEHLRLREQSVQRVAARRAAS